MQSKVVLAISLVAAGLIVGGCSVLDPGPPRDGDGRVTEAATISARDLQNKDCFTFNSADGGVVELVTVMPCAESHEYLVIAQGTLTTADVSAAGSLQNAVSAACKPSFEEFKSATKGPAKPKQEFLVYPASDEAGADQLYSCIATDPDQDFVATSPSPTPSPTP